MQVLKELGIEVGVYVSSEIDLDAVKVTDVYYITTYTLKFFKDFNVPLFHFIIIF